MGPLAFKGTAEAPITLRPSNAKKGWQGIAVMRAGARSELRHTRVIHTTGVAKPGWSLTGGVTFYESDVDVVATTFKGHNGEDALNIVRSDFVIDGTTFDTTLSDAFDSDFSTGKVTKSTFINIGTAGGGDAIDTSGSVVEITDVTFRQVSDKAISAGEASTVTASDIVIDDTGTGLASKDRSTLTASKSRSGAPSSPRSPPTSRSPNTAAPRSSPTTCRSPAATPATWSRTAAASCSPGANSTPRTSTSTRSTTPS